MDAIDYNSSYYYYMDLAAAWCRKDSDQQSEYDQCLALAPGFPMQDVAAIDTVCPSKFHQKLRDTVRVWRLSC